MNLKLIKSQFRHRCKVCQGWIEAGEPHYKHPRTLYHHHRACVDRQGSETVAPEIEAMRPVDSLGSGDVQA